MLISSNTSIKYSFEGVAITLLANICFKITGRKYISEKLLSQTHLTKFLVYRRLLELY